MKPEEINMAIAEKCGYSEEEIKFGYTLSQMSEPLPDYYNSLDACAEFERTLDIDGRREYADWLHHLTNSRFELCCATPDLRCAAFLMMHGVEILGETNEKESIQRS